MDEKVDILIRHGISCENNIEEAVFLMNEFVEETEEVLNETDKATKREKRKRLNEKKQRLQELLGSLKKLQFHSEIKKRKIRADLEKLLNRVEKDMANSGFYKKVLDSSMDSRKNTLQFNVGHSPVQSEHFLNVPEPTNAFLEESMRDPVKASRHMSQYFSRLENEEREDDIMEVVSAADLINKFANIQSSIVEGSEGRLSEAQKNIYGAGGEIKKANAHLKGGKSNQNGKKSVIQEDEEEQKTSFMSPSEAGSKSNHYNSVKAIGAPKKEDEKESKAKEKSPNVRFCCV